MSVHVPLSAFVFSSTGIDAFTLVCASVIPPLPLSVLHTFVDTDMYWVGCRGLTWFRSGGHTCEKIVYLVIIVIQHQLKEGNGSSEDLLTEHC